MIGGSIAGAIFSANRQYRYALWRVWDKEQPAMVFIGLNPSYANRYKDDATVSKLVGHAKVLKFGGLYIGNLFAKVTPYPEQLYGKDAVGRENDKYLRELKRVAGTIVVGWGNHGGDEKAGNRHKKVLDILGKPVYCFAVTKQDMPMHPLYISYATELREYLPDPDSERRRK